MSRVRSTIAELMALVLIVGLCFASLRNRDNLWGFVYILALVVLAATDRWWVRWIRSKHGKRWPAVEEDQPKH